MPRRRAVTRRELGVGWKVEPFARFPPIVVPRGGLGARQHSQLGNLACKSHGSARDPTMVLLEAFASPQGMPLPLVRLRESRSEERRVGKECRSRGVRS